MFDNFECRLKRKPFDVTSVEQLIEHVWSHMINLTGTCSFATPGQYIALRSNKVANCKSHECVFAIRESVPCENPSKVDYPIYTIHLDNQGLWFNTTKHNQLGIPLLCFEYKCQRSKYRITCQMYAGWLDVIDWCSSLYHPMSMCIYIYTVFFHMLSFLVGHMVDAYLCICWLLVVKLWRIMTYHDAWRIHVSSLSTSATLPLWPHPWLASSHQPAHSKPVDLPQAALLVYWDWSDWSPFSIEECPQSALLPNHYRKVDTSIRSGGEWQAIKKLSGSIYSCRNLGPSLDVNQSCEIPNQQFSSCRHTKRTFHHKLGKNVRKVRQVRPKGQLLLSSHDLAEWAKPQ